MILSNHLNKFHFWYIVFHTFDLMIFELDFTLIQGQIGSTMDSAFWAYMMTTYDFTFG